MIFDYFALLLTIWSNGAFCINYMWLAQNYSKNISEKVCQKICSDIGINVNFHFFPLQVNGNFKQPKFRDNLDKNSFIGSTCLYML